MDRLPDLQRRMVAAKPPLLPADEKLAAAPPGPLADAQNHANIKENHKSKSKKNGESPRPRSVSVSPPLSPVPSPAPLSSISSLEKFFHNVEKLHCELSAIQHDVEDLKSKQNESLLNTDVEHGKHLADEMDKLANSISTKSKIFKQKLKVLEEETRQLAKHMEENPAEYRIHINQLQQLGKAFVETMKTNQANWEAYKERNKDQVKRRIRTRCSLKDTNGQPLNDEQIDRYAQQIIEVGKEDAVFAQAQDLLQEVQENHRDILRIEASMRELHQLFDDMAVVVAEQGELMDDILENINQSVEYSKKAHAELQKAKEHAKKHHCIIS